MAARDPVRERRVSLPVPKAGEVAHLILEVLLVSRVDATNPD